VRLTVSRDFFLQFASKTWLSPFSIIRELVEDCYDEDATRVIVTLPKTTLWSRTTLEWTLRRLKSSSSLEAYTSSLSLTRQGSTGLEQAGTGLAA
jgi:hypothetical protein